MTSSIQQALSSAMGTEEPVVQESIDMQLSKSHQSVSLAMLSEVEHDLRRDFDVEITAIEALAKIPGMNDRTLERWAIFDGTECLADQYPSKGTALDAIEESGRDLTARLMYTKPIAPAINAHRVKAYAIINKIRHNGLMRELVIEAEILR